MKLCKLLLPPMDVNGVRHTEIGDRVELTDGDAEMFANCGVVEILAEPAPISPPETPAETPDEPEAVEPAEAVTEPLEAPAKKAKR